METTGSEHTVAQTVIEGALGDVNQDKSIIAERIRMKLLEQSLIREEHQLVVQVAIGEAVLEYRRTRVMPSPPLAQVILNTLRRRQLLK